MNIFPFIPNTIIITLHFQVKTHCKMQWAISAYKIPGQTIFHSRKILEKKKEIIIIIIKEQFKPCKGKQKWQRRRAKLTMVIKQHNQNRGEILN